MKKIFLILNIVFITSCSSQIKNIEKQTFKYNHKITDFKNLENNRSDFSPSTSNNYVIYNKENDTIEIGANNIDGSFLFKKKSNIILREKK